MPELINTLWSQVQGMAAWELLAVVCALIYLALAMLEKISCWYFAFVSTAIYTVIFWKVSLLMESALQIYYLFMAVFGWWQWRRPKDESAALEIHCWTWRQHLIAVALILVLSVASGTLLQQFSQAAMPFLDSFTTWGAVITTYMVARKVLENWIYWFVIDGISIYLYLDRGLVFTAALFVLYEIMVVMGFWHWRRQMQQSKASAGLQAA
ncbi:nicotinamide riboside transporter PnuC [Pseudoteredinibacter isoporae]|uniref:Nicotinamide riboside transporter PnuC n=1 Tax=Pseudoteredinibacter isoporae TaxID=570281 RepID=A0A7X0JSS2_9GAMM|nr:nicotinamide riboside transporter PnuC [Pseudoteredinibacter isoporae]MBB6521623.1 nicotinamide mononucleotide transporter [Pseudoteredinibacter isoporae]NHO87177.1 nicotinamide mononucleotide transporter [Pseudoteredinibacter isoporae]NIB23001.1 nicotinamide mononucleotide transporter [Pseudoteredinibacter isoporae]